MTQNKEPRWLLIVDDDPGIRETTNDILELKGYALASAASGLEAMEVLADPDREFEVAVVDLVLPDVKGLELIERIQEMSPRTQVIMMTGYASVDTAVSGLRANVVDYLQKPINVDFLVATIERALERRDKLIAEDAVFNAAQEWRMTFDTIPDLIMIIGPDFRVKKLNRATKDFIGGEYHQLVGRLCHELIHGLDQPATNCPHLQTIQDHKSHSAEIYLKDRDRYFLATTSPLYDDGQNYLGCVQVMRDVSERRLMQSQIVRSEKLASVGQLAAGVAHEVNNPLAFIMANLGQLAKYADSYRRALAATQELVKQTGDADQSRVLEQLVAEHDLDYIGQDLDDLLAQSQTGLVRIRNIVADLRKLSHMGEDDVGDVNLNDIVRSAVNIAKNDIRVRGRLELELNDVPNFPGIGGRIAHAVLNLIVNAVHSLDESQLESNLIRVMTGRKKDGVFVQISDNGRGMDAETASRIFDPFFTTKKAGEGSGLGLSICQDIATKHKGVIEVESEPGKGSAFTFWVPLETGLGKGAPKEAALGKKSGPRAPAARIMIIDDEKEIVKALTRVLSKHQVSGFTDPQEAVAELKQDPGYDLIICDMIMPPTSGQAVYEEAVAARPEIEPRFLFLTGGVYDQTLRDFARSMEGRIVHKPLQSDELEKLVDDRIGSQRANAGPQPETGSQ